MRKVGINLLLGFELFSRDYLEYLTPRGVRTGISVSQSPLLT